MAEDREVLAASGRVLLNSGACHPAGGAFSDPVDRKPGSLRSGQQAGGALSEMRSNR